MKKIIIIIISMLVGMSFAYSAQIPHPHAIDFAELNNRAEEMINERMQGLPYNFSIVSDRSNYYTMMLVGNITLSFMQFFGLLTLYILKHSEIANIPIIPLGGSIRLNLKDMAGQIAIIPAYIAISLMRNQNTQALEPFAGDFPDKAVLGTLVLSAGMGFGLFYKLMHVYYHIDAVKSLRSKKLIIKSKINFDQDFLADKKCLICHCELENPINCCDQKDHLFCTTCLTSWFEELEKTSDIVSFKCTACTQKVIKSNEKISINRLEEESPSYKNFIKSLVGKKGILLALLACNFYYLMYLTIK